MIASLFSKDKLRAAAAPLKWAGMGAACVLIAACSERDERLPGTRLSLEQFEGEATGQSFNQVAPVSLPAAVVNANWTQRNGSSRHVISHPVLSPGLSLVMQVPIGEGSSRRARITGDPVVSNGVVYAVDARSTVTAISTSGQVIWRQSLVPPLETARSTSGGGVAVEGNRVFVTTGYGELVALDARTGAQLWVQDTESFASSAPTVFNGVVYVETRLGEAWAIDVEFGRVRWTTAATPGPVTFSGGAGAAVSSDIAVFPFASGDVVATFPEGGLRRWTSSVRGERLGSAAAAIKDIAGDPIIAGNSVYVGNYGGQITSLDLFSGDRNWATGEGVAGPMWLAGDSLYFVNDLNEFIRMRASTGDVIWRQRLTQFEETNARRMKTFYAHTGPVLAGSRLILPSSDGVLREFDPRSGALIGQTEIPGGAASNPAVAGGVLYVVSKSGHLLGYQ